MKMSLSKKRVLEGYLFILPWIIGFLVFLAFPLGQSLVISFEKLEVLFGFKFEFIGMKNYFEAFLVDVNFVPAFIVIVRDVLINIPLILIFSIGMAYLVNQKLRGRGVFKIIFFVPVVIVSGPVIQRLFLQGVGVASIFQRLDIGGFIYTYFDPIIADPLIEILNRIIFILWRSGVPILICLAGFQAISPALYEAAKCDGADEWLMFWKITLPMLMPILEIAAIYSIIDSFTDVFNPLLNYIKHTVFKNFRYGYGAAMGWTYFILIFGIILITLAVFKKYMSYAEER